MCFSQVFAIVGLKTKSANRTKCPRKESFIDLNKSEIQYQIVFKLKYDFTSKSYIYKYCQFLFSYTTGQFNK
jgi:hypothetical protein